ncbi:hypothetical protein [Malaciobacter marinus]|uniref:hypothetical protein n=1 Tax=Malaciobacter marinus TaxID=505249 RepID=UPI003AFFA314
MFGSVSKNELKTINKILALLDPIMHNIKDNSKLYSNNDYTKQISISSKLKEKVLLVIKGVNALEKVLRTVKINLSNETIHIIENVSVASKEQMTGIEQINDTITMLDRVTQENASEATQISNIASDVSKMAKELVNDAKSKQF